MSSGRQKQLDQQQNYWNTQSQNAINQASQPTALQTAYEGKQQKFLDWDASKDKNIEDAPGMQEHIQIGRSALNRFNRERMGTGALRLGGSGGYADKLRVQKQAELSNEFGAGLEEALALRRAEANNSVIPLSQLTNNRLMGVAGIASNNYSSLVNRPRQQPFWQQLLMGAVGAGAQVGSAFIGR